MEPGAKSLIETRKAEDKTKSKTLTLNPFPYRPLCKFWLFHALLLKKKVYLLQCVVTKVFTVASSVWSIFLAR